MSALWGKCGILAMTTPTGAGSNPLAGGSSANAPATNPLAGGSPTPNPAQSGAPAAGAGSNPLAGGSSDPQNPTPLDDNAPISADVYREKARSEAALRQRVKDLEAKFKAQEDAKLTEQERTAQRVQELEAERPTWLARLKDAALQRVVDARVRERNLVDPAIILAVLSKAEFADQIDYDDNGNPVNAEYQIDRAVEKYPSLLQPPSSPQQNQPPNSGRQVSPPRPPAGQFVNQRYAAPQAPIPYAQFERLGDLTESDWDTSSRKNQQGQR